MARCVALPAAVEVLVAAEEWDDARAAAEELWAIASDFDSTALQAMAAYASASLPARRGRARARPGRRRGRRAGDGSDLDCPYEAARARVLVARALRDMGDAESAVAELTAARQVFVELGAEPAVREVDRLIERAAPAG